MSSQNWMEHFKDRIKGLAPNSAKAGHSLLWTAIKKNMIRSHEYMTWVQQNLQAITLRSDYFLSVPITPQVYKKWNAHYSWNPECLPLYEWDGVLYVGCLEKPRSFPTSIRCVFVYCPVEGLETGWNQWQSLGRNANKPSPQEIINLAEKDPMAALEKTMVMSGELSEDFLAQIQAGDENSEEASSTNTDEISAEDNEAPEGMTLQARSNLSKPELTLSRSSEQSLTKSGSAPSLDKTKIIEHTSTVIPMPPKRKKTSESVGEHTNTSFGKTAIMDKTRIIEHTSTSIPLPPKKKTSGGGVANSKPVKKRNFNISPGASFQPSVFDILGNLQADKVKNSVNQVFNEMKNHFSKSMILKINGDSFTPWKWDDGFNSKPEKPQPLPLQTPSIFRVPWRTRKPYHGYIVPNDVNEAFFDEWNQTRIPDHVTIVPIIVHDNVTGLLLGIANKPINTEQSLSTAEKLAHKLVDELIGA